ncbi:MAG: hypothetical protein NVSMB64_12990 [Candidatus Velthaea sp.]
MSGGDPSTDEFERTFFGGLMTTCGLDAFGPPGQDRWGSWPQHGHVNRLQARAVRWDVRYVRYRAALGTHLARRSIRELRDARRADATARDEQAARGIAVWNRGGLPDGDFREQVFIHEPSADELGWATATAVNPDLAGGTSLAISYRPEQLPALFTWRMLGYGTYVMSAEPANCTSIEGRIAAERRGILPILEPGETREYILRFSVQRA